MRKSQFINDHHVKGFIQWIAPKIDTPGAFCHSYILSKSHSYWGCDSIYSAYERYAWGFSLFSSTINKLVSGATFNDTMMFTGQISRHLKEGLKKNDAAVCRCCCLDILKWGGVLSHNDVKIIDMGDSLCQYLMHVNTILQADKSSNEYYSRKIIINSGFTKIYSLFIEDFIMYDGRVGAALGFLARKYCEENNLAYVPGSLRFAWGRGKESYYVSRENNRRNPSSARYAFPEILNNPERHLESNIRANWLLRDIIESTKSRFSQLNPDIQTTALQAALFMLGYCVKAQ